MRSKYGLDPRDVLRVIGAALIRLELGTGHNLFNTQGKVLLLGTAMVESNLAHLQQVGGPALGLWQMEPRTHDDIVVNYIAARPSLREAFTANGALAAFASFNLVYDLRYAAMMARVHYLRVPEALPPVDAEALAAYWKRYYNTPLGKGTVAKAVPHFREAIKVVQNAS